MFTTGLELLVKVARAGGRVPPVHRPMAKMPAAGGWDEFHAGLAAKRRVDPSSVRAPAGPAASIDGGPRASWADMHRGVQNLHAAGVAPPSARAPLPTPASAASQVWSEPPPSKAKASAPAKPPAAPQTPSPPTNGGAPPPAPEASAAASNSPSKWKRNLGLAGLGAAGTLAYGAHQQSEEDRRRNALVYAPMPGSVLQ